MDSLHALVLQGKVLYLGISDSPAWVVSKANTYARMSGKTPFVIYQGKWNIMERDFERDIVPMAIAEGWLCPRFIILGLTLYRDGNCTVGRACSRENTYRRRGTKAPGVG